MSQSGDTRRKTLFGVGRVGGGPSGAQLTERPCLRALGLGMGTAQPQNAQAVGHNRHQQTLRAPWVHVWQQEGGGSAWPFPSLSLPYCPLPTPPIFHSASYPELFHFVGGCPTLPCPSISRLWVLTWPPDLAPASTCRALRPCLWCHLTSALARTP